MKDTDKINRALAYAIRYGGIDGAHHKAWVIDQMIRALTGCPMVKRTATDCHGKPYTYEAQGESAEYTKLIAESCAGEDGPNTWEHDVGTPP